MGYNNSDTATCGSAFQLNDALGTNCRYEEVQKIKWFAMWADWASRVFFPLGFLTFTAVYCGVYIA
jgi:hypothetical protein